MTRLRKTVLAAFVGASILTGAGVALAQEDAVLLDEIIVSAQKRDESLQDVPISVTAISGTTLEDLAVRSFDDVLELIPGLSSDSPVGQGVGTRSFGIRGVQSQGLAYLVSENTVGFYIDNTPIPLSDPRLVDLERVEVLRGPQGTLYGSSTLAGLMKLVTKKPSFDEFSGHVQVEFPWVTDGDSGHDFQGAVNIPISDNLAVRVSGYVEETPGYIDWRPVGLFGTPTGEPDIEDFDPSDNTGARLAARWEPNERLSINFSYMQGENDGTSVGFSDAFAPSLGSDPVALGRRPANQLREFNLITGEIEYDFGPVTLQMTNSEFDNETRTQDADGTEAFGLLATPTQETYGDYHLFRDEFVHETRLISNWDKNWNFILGGFYNKRKQSYHTRFPQLPGTVVDLGPLLGLPPGIVVFPNPPSNFIFASDSTRLIEESALFGELSYDFNDQWRASIGLRAFDFESELFDRFRGNAVIVTGGDVTLTGASDASDTNGRINVQYRPNDDTMFFATVAEGFRAGGSNFPLPAGEPGCADDILDKLGPAGTQPTYDQDTVLNTEIGVKKTWGGGRVTTNAAIFRMDWDDMQLLISPLCGLNGYIANAGKVVSSGFEFDMDAAITDGLTMGGGLSYTKAEFDGDASPDGGNFLFAADGDPVPDVPELTFNVRMMWDFALTSTMDAFVRGTLTYRDERKTRATALIPTRTKEDYTLLNLRAGVHLNDTWTLMIFGQNLTDERPSLAGLPLQVTNINIGGLETDNTLQPRTMGITLRADF